MKVAIIHAKLGNKGGLETRLHNYIAYFLNRGDEVTVIFSHADENIEVSAKVRLVKLGVRHIPKPFRPFAFYLKVKKYFKTHTFDFSLSLGRTAGQKVVLAPATHLGYLKYLKKSVRTLSDYMQVFLDKQSYARSEHVFACSEMVRRELMELYNVEEDKVSVLYPPFNTSNYRPEVKECKYSLRIKKGFSEGQVLFLFVSTGHYRKGLDFLLNLFSTLDATIYQLIIVGKPEVKTLLQNVHYMGFEKDLNEWYGLTDYLIHPAKYEPYGQIITEALYMKTPVLISDKVGAKELIGEKEGLVLPEGDVLVWKKAMEDLRLENFSFETDFVSVHNLSLDRHMETMLNIFVK